MSNSTAEEWWREQQPIEYNETVAQAQLEDLLKYLEYFNQSLSAFGVQHKLLGLTSSSKIEDIRYTSSVLNDQIAKIKRTI